MKTVVYQSYRTVDVPKWMEDCMASVRTWAEKKGYDYVFMDDAFLNYAPAWYREAARGSLLLITDLARLEVAHEFLRTGYQRTIWVDADILVFDPDRFDIPVEREYAFCREVWLRKQELFGRTLPIVRCDHKVNNAVTVFTENNSMLDFYRASCHRLLANMPTKFDPGYVSTTFLTWLHPRIDLPLLTNVGLFSPLLVNDLASNTARYIPRYMKKFGHRIAAANLCSTFRNGRFMGVDVNDELYDQAIESMLATNGDVLNSHLPEDVRTVSAPIPATV
jgi:hypothetical protein